MKQTLSIDSLSIGYQIKNERKVLHKGISFDICKEELCCLLGPNGAGKSTLLRTIAGFQPKFEGMINFKERSINEYTNNELAKTVSVVLTDKFESGNLKVIDIVAMGRYPYTNFIGRYSEKDTQIIHNAISVVGIENFKDRYFHSLSDGEKQKVMIAKALAQDTEIMILDEPTAFLDFPSKIEIMRLLKQLARESGKAILLSTHDVELAIQSADKILLMGKDLPFESGIPEDLILRNKIHDFFVKPGVVFSNKYGNFRLEQECLYGINVIGEGMNYQWLKHALRRKRIDVNNPKSKIVINITEQGYMFTDEDKENLYHNIESVLDQAIHSIQNQK